MPTAVVVIPTRNEEKSIEGVIAEVRQAFAGLRYDRLEILITDDSVDGTRAVARRAGAHVVNGGGEGLGAAMYRGLKESLAFEPDVILTIDGDGQTDARTEIPRFLAVLEGDEADLVLGSRFKGGGLVQYRYKPLNRLGTRVLTYFLNAKTGLGLTDSHGGIRAMRAAVARELQMIGTHTYVQETIIDAAEKGFRIVELPSAWRVRKHGSSRVVGSIPKYVFYTLPIILLRSGHHVRTLYNTGLLLVAAALVYFGVVVVEEGFTWRMGHRTPAFMLIALLVSTGIQLFFFGFMLQLLNQIKRTVDRVIYPSHESLRHPPPVTPPRPRVVERETTRV
jgi:glycosyltransferase involved in cell wall biosynthesis